MKISNKEKKIMLIMITVAVLLGLIALLFVRLNYNAYYVKKANEKNDVTISSIGLTDSQKISDFDFLCQTINESMMFKSEYEQISGINFDEYIEKYREAIPKAETDFDYYAIIYNMISNIPSQHTNVISSYDRLCNSNIYNTDNVCGKKNIDAYFDYWNKLLWENVEKLKGFEYYPFSYLSTNGGEYLYNNISGISSRFDENTIISINGIDIDEYIKTDIYNTDIYFDGINQKYYKPVLFFSNNPNHTPIELILQNKSGERYSETLYADFKYFIIPYMIEELPIVESVITEKFYIFDDNENDFTYCVINRVDSQNKSILSEELSQSKKNVIVDLRNNGGGNIYNLKEAIAPIINKESVYEYKWYVPISKQNINAIYFGTLTDRISALINKPYSSVSVDGKEMISFGENMKVESTAAEQHNVYVLVDMGTCSAADRIADVFLNQPYTLVIGDNTGGEGLGGPAIMSVLPQSCIVFSYYASYPNGSCINSILGTEPELYIIDSDYEQHLLCETLFENGNDPYTYENRLKWDNVLIETVELIKEDENDK